MKQTLLIGLGILGMMYLPLFAEAGKPHVQDRKPELQAIRDPKKCVKSGGLWSRGGMDGRYTGCFQKSKDAGKSCKDSTECEGACQAIFDPKGEIKLKNGSRFSSQGQCSDTVQAFCWTMVNGTPNYNGVCSAM